MPSGMTFPGCFCFSSLSPPNISVIFQGNLYFPPVWRPLNKSGSFVSMPLLLICISFTCREKECGDDGVGGCGGGVCVDWQRFSAFLFRGHGGWPGQQESRTLWFGRVLWEISILCLEVSVGRVYGRRWPHGDLTDARRSAGGGLSSSLA